MTSSFTETVSSASRIDEQISDETQLPTQPSALPFLVQALADTEIDVRDVAESIERFPNIAARLVSLANSAWSAPVEPITSIERTCAHLGLRLVKTVSMSLAVTAPFDTVRCPEFDSEMYWCNTFLVADSAAHLTVHADAGQTVLPEVVRTAGLFHNLGLLWLADKMPQPTAEALAVVKDEGIELNTALRDYCNTDAGVIGGLLGRAWGLPDDFVAAMEHCGNTEYEGTGWQIAALVGVATGIVSAATRGEQVLANDSNLDRLDIEPGDCDEILGRVLSKLSETLELTRTLRL